MKDGAGNGLLLSVVIPCYNEEGNIAELIARTQECRRLEPRIGFILVNNGSTDSTGELLESVVPTDPGYEIVHLDTNRGYGSGIKAGLRVARTRFAGWTHADLQTNPLDCIPALEAALASEGPCLVKGTRTGRPAVDRFFTAGMSVLESILFKRLIRDVNAQPTILSIDVVKRLDNGPDDFSLDLFALVQARQLGIKDTRVPVTFGARFSGDSKWNTSTRARLKFIFRTVKYSWSLARSRGIAE